MRDRTRAAQVAGRARAAQESAAEARRRGNATSARLRAGDRDWGRKMALARALKRGQLPLDPTKEIQELERRLARVEALLCIHANAPGGQPEATQEERTNGGGLIRTAS